MTNVGAPPVSDCFTASVFGSSVTMPLVTTATTVPSVVSATGPTGLPVVLYDTTGFVSLARSIAKTASARPPHLPVVEA